ncbi:RyR domain-containing protein [Desulfitobacterium metallireducens]|uniref:Ryanodine receptor Ryr n=1 Tax=Desulfitobacterium metallireducens DSM 15288 TaxID=871968 RepID=W0EI04_9FIRM|nr:RyR domain-containing protein [Desulfitobacterium metallireducens]AHF08676.1 hypothetical protein DESME_14185 [Desulfitobacterium metallireducens DSM 15288]
MLHYIGDSAKRIDRIAYTENGVNRVKEDIKILGAMGIAQKMGSEIDNSCLVSLTASNNGTTYGIPENEQINDWNIDQQQLSSNDFVVLYDLDIAQRQHIPVCDATTIAFLKHRNINLLRNATLRKTEKPKLIPIVSMNDLRANGATVSKAISWERTATDFLRDLSYGICQELLAKFPVFVVLLETDGMLVRQNDILTLYFTPAKAEGDTGSLENEGIRNAICTQIVKQIATEEYEFSKVLPNAIGVQALPNLDQLEAPESWSILNEVCGRDRLELIEAAKRIVINGEKEILDAVPSCQYGGLQTVDRMEIENYRAIVNLMQNYAKDKDNRPLSLAVFGFPGSGKSFGIKQIAKTLGGFEIFVFNLSQFTKLSELEVSFQEIRDASIKGERLPLVFFDEFDSSFNGEALGWLKYFLAPMQDGVFMEDGRERQLGRAIFVFAGGTSTSFHNFIRSEQELFKKVKGPDFISRLKGYLNIQGPNPVNQEDKAYIIRRAMLLRSMIGRSAKQLLDSNQKVNIDENILYALLTTETYRHGARSLEFFISMSPLLGEKKWYSSLLPPRSQMDIHVDAEEFMSKVSVLGMCKELAKMSHEMYLEAELAKSPNKDLQAVTHWKNLNETYQKSNISQIQFHIERFIDSNIAIRQKTLPNKEFVFNDEDLLELSKAEHDRWYKERIRDGWVYGDKRDNSRKVHNNLVPWEQLSKEDKQKDTDVILRIPLLFNKIGLELYYR